jgi:hypothetical protein
MHSITSFINDLWMDSDSAHELLSSASELEPCWPLKKGGVMHTKECYLDQVGNEVEDLSSRVALLKTNFDLQTPTVKLEHYWELEHIRSCFKEFKIRVGDLEDADDLRLERNHDAVEVARNDLVQAVDALLGALPGVSSTNYVM